MESLQRLITESQRKDIHLIAEYIVRHEEAGNDAVIERLALISDDFKNALDMQTEVAQYLADNPSEG